MSLLVATFTHDGNVSYLMGSLVSALVAIRRSSLFLHTNLVVYDFTDPPNSVIKDSIPRDLGIPYEVRIVPRRGFCANMNMAMDYALACGKEYLVAFNDDAFVEPDFIENALIYMDKSRNVGLAGVIPQDGYWNHPIRNVRFPLPKLNVDEPITNFAYLHWEASACIIAPSRLRGVRFDEEFDNFLGLCGDNDFLLRLVLAGVEVRRLGKLRFYHCRGITQTKFGRNPFLNPDPIREAAVAYFNTKWGVDISDMNIPLTADQVRRSNG